MATIDEVFAEFPDEQRTRLSERTNQQFAFTGLVEPDKIPKTSATSSTTS